MQVLQTCHLRNLRQLRNLEMLDLSYNAITGFTNYNGNKYSSGLQKNKFGPSLEFLNLSNNSLEGHIPNDIYNSSRLQNLDLSYNRLNGLLPKNFSSNIQTLRLNDNRLSGHVTDAFCNSFSRLSRLDLSNNDLRGRIPAAINNLTQLQALFLRGNQFNGQIPFQLCLVELRLLDLSSNNLYGSIPTCLSQLFTSRYGGGSPYVDIGMDFELINDGRVGELISMKLDSAHNIIYSKAEFVTKNMAYNYEGNMTNILLYMYGIDLSCNKLTGHIPHELGNLSNIQTLNLSHNQLWGVIPSSFSNLKNIESLDLSFNHLNGRIPAEATNLNTLEVFNVSYNNLSGKIPFQAQSSTFDATSYKGNPFLCGLPFPINCTTDDTPSTSTSESQDEDSGWIDMEAFYITFTGSGVTMFLAVVIIMLINPHWWNAWFYLAKACILYSYYFFEDNIRKLRRARRV
ncbi:LRR receptor-like serine/threonine-protein kinase EFR [Chenopodium quinoa]|uniref:LRR receptor-like serine/threonine-protein kinase EFR n=1 Tax=Chenopodium quinoa TaxID=63459 RepID=UPI000B78D6E3|nr:LRR receptor-like serine/threonine-protein kinase EFR [Chenopodium quinoa]